MKIVNGKIFNRLSMLAMVSLIFVAAVAAMTIPTVEANGFFLLYVDPPYQEVPVCTNFIVKVNVSFYVPVSGVSLNLTFDPNLMECISVTNTSFPPGIIDKLLDFNNTAGWVIVRIDAEPAFGNDGTIAEITFHCKDVGTSSLNFTKYIISYKDNDGPPRAALFNGTVSQVRPVGGEVLAIDALALLIPWIAAAGAVAVATILVLASRRTFNH